MITPLRAIEEVRTLINVPSVTSLVSRIYADEATINDLDAVMAAKQKFIAVNCLEHDFDQIQTGTVNVNIYVPDLPGGKRDIISLDAILLAIKPLLEDATTDNISTDLGRPTILKEEGKPYSFYNQRVNIFSDTLDQLLKNFKDKDKAKNEKDLAKNLEGDGLFAPNLAGADEEPSAMLSNLRKSLAKILIVKNENL